MSDAFLPGVAPPNLLTVEEVAGHLRVSRTTIYRLVERRLLAFYRLRGGLRFSEGQVIDYLRRCRVETIDQQRL